MSYPPSATTMIAFFGEQDISDLLSDDGTPVLSANFAANTTLATILKAACGHLEAACTVSNIYSADDIEDLTGNSEAP